MYEGDLHKADCSGQVREGDLGKDSSVVSHQKRSGVVSRQPPNQLLTLKSNTIMKKPRGKDRSLTYTARMPDRNYC